MIFIRSLFIFSFTLFSLSAALSSSFALAEKPMRIASLGLCTDQLLIQMVEPERIVALSNMAENENMSYMAKTAQQLHKPIANLETLIELKPDLIIGTHYSRPEVLRMLKRLGYNVKTAALPMRYDAIPDLIREMGDWFAEPQRAETLINEMNNTLAMAQERISGLPPISAMIYSPNGYTIGKNTIENDLLTLAGFSNLAVEMEIDGFNKVSLEQLVMNQPEVILIDNHIKNKSSLANALLTHPVLEKISANNTTRPFIPSRLRACAGNMTAEAVKYLVDNR